MNFILLKKFLFNSHLGFMGLSKFNKFLYQKMAFFAGSFWVSVSSLFVTLFSFIHIIFFRVKGDGNYSGRRRDSRIASHIEPRSEDDEVKSDIFEFKDSEIEKIDENDETERPEFCFKFQFPSYEDFIKRNTENFDSAGLSLVNKYEFMPEKNLIGFVEESELMSFTVKEFDSDSSRKTEIMEIEYMEREQPEKVESLEYSVSGEEQSVYEQVTVVQSETGFNSSDSDSDSNHSSHEVSFTSHLIDSNGPPENSVSVEEQSDEQVTEFLSEKDLNLSESHSNSTQLIFTSDLIDSSNDGFLSDKDFEAQKDEIPAAADSKSEELKDMESSIPGDFEESNELESLWEHQDLIEQLKMDLKKVRAINLPTILEESESPKIMDDLKPWKIDLKFQYEDRMNELHKFYKSYRERMRKLDILNYQKMYAIGFLQSKDTFESILSSKNSSPPLTSILTQNLKSNKNKNCEVEPKVKFMRELHSDLEMVYVGQLCLSWEILHWQYQKALEFWDSDPKGIRRYNEVAGEFQQLQVLMQRFLENEPFEGPRVQNYVKKLCVFRNLLQVPVIREDNMRDKTKARRGRMNADAITNDVLVEIMEDSIRNFWRFIRSDKYSHNSIQLQDPSDFELLRDVQTNLQKKEKKLKDILRTGNCIIKKFQKRNDNRSDQVLYFFSQVDMKLVTRVINMSRITREQLVWCSDKLNNISFVNRKIHVDTSFLLFPC